MEAKGASAEEIAESPRLLSQRAKRGLETKDRDMLRRGVAGIAISFARALNGLLGRKGKVWADRHHRRDLATPTEVRNALRPPARTWLLGRGWLRAGGPISTNDAPPLSPRVRLSPEARAYESEQATARRRLDVPS